MLDAQRDARQGDLLEDHLALLACVAVDWAGCHYQFS